MKDKFNGCQGGCTLSLGSEQPAFVIQNAPTENLPNTCLITSNPSSTDCYASHPYTIRLCPCFLNNV